MRIPRRKKKWSCNAARMFQLPGRELSELINGKTLEEFRLNSALHICRYGLDGFFTYFRPMVLFIAHAANLSTHSQGTGFTGVFRRERLPHVAKTYFPAHL
jgi:hypothetical protein